MADLSGLTTNFFPTADELFSSTLSGTISGGAATVGITNLARYANGDIVTLTVAPGDGTKQRTFTGVVNTGTNQVTNCVWTEDPYSYSTGSYAAGTTVKDWRSATHTAQVSKGIRIEHNVNGTHANITATSITTTGNGAIGGTFAVTGVTTLTGGLAVGNTTATMKDESGNTVDINPMRRNEGFQGKNFIQTGLNPSSAAGLVVTIPAGTYYIAGKRYTYAGGTKTLTASKDCYLDIDTAGAITAVEVANGATSGMTLTTNGVRFAKIVTGGASVSSYTITGWDSLGNPIRNLDPYTRELNYSTRTTNQTTTSTSYVALDATIDLNVIVPVSGRVKLDWSCEHTNSGANSNFFGFFDVTSSAIGSGATQVGQITQYMAAASASQNGNFWTEITGLTAGATKKYGMGMKTSAGTMTIVGSATSPMQLRANAA